MSVYHVASIVGIVLIAILAAMVLVLGVRYIVRIERRITRQAEQIKALEAAQGRKIPYDLQELAENMIAAVVSLEMGLDMEKAKLDNIKGHAGKILTYNTKRK